MKYLKKIILAFIIVLGILYVFFGLLLFFFQRSLIYYPNTQDFNSCSKLPLDVAKVTYEGTRMYVHKTTDNWIVIYHGNAGSACDRSYYFNYFDTSKYSYIIVEYAGYSNDTESPSQNALIKNVQAVVDYLRTQKVSEKIVIGESLGTALASYHSYVDRPNKLILISSFDSLENISQSMYWFYPIKLILRDAYPSAKWLADANNVLMIHGSNDSTIPIKFGKLLFDQISGANKTFITVHGASHNDIYNYNLTRTSIVNFLQ